LTDYTKYIFGLFVKSAKDER